MLGAPVSGEVGDSVGGVDGLEVGVGVGLGEGRLVGTALDGVEEGA